MLGYSELVQLIMENDCVYSYLIYYYIEWISEQDFEESVKEWMLEGKTVREVHARYFAAWIPHDPHGEKIVQKIKDLANIGR